MNIVKASIELMNPDLNGMDVLKAIEKAGRICYKSEDKITNDSALKFVKTLIDRGHEAMIEHAPSISIKFICDRGVSHEIVRHRLFSFAQESTRYCNYGKQDEISVIEPLFWNIRTDQMYYTWLSAMNDAEKSYLALLKAGASPQEARSVLPNSLKTEIIVTGNVREWRHFFKLRTAQTAHPQMREVADMALSLLRSIIPIVFDDI
jgi:thymidylate synthase (FAD)